jgi:spoIIIJ-associated protein
MSEQPSMQEYVDAAREILEALLRQMEFADAQVQSAIEDNQIFFEIVTAEAGRLIGRTSQTLDAVQFLVNRLLSRRFEDSPYCVVDAEQYRARRREKLLADAQEALQHVRSTGQSWRMPLLNAMDRRVIHQALKDCPDIETYSEDEEPDGRKRVVICLIELPSVVAEAPEADGAAAESPAEPA